MARAIHVPRGCAARVARNTAVLDLPGLYAEGVGGPAAFVVMAVRDRASLFFAGPTSRAAQVEEELDWVSEGFPEPPLIQAFVNCPEGRATVDALCSADRSPRVVALSPDDHGLLVALARKDGEKDWQTGVMTLVKGTFEGELVRHPLEREFLTARAVNVVVGSDTAQDHLLFDGRHWEALSPSDTQPCTRTATYLALRQAVRPSLPHGAVVAVVQKFLLPPSAAMEDIDTLAFYTQDHFCAATADGDALFRADMAQALAAIADSPATAPSTQQDGAVLAALQAALAGEGAAYEAVRGHCAPHAASADSTAFLGAVLHAFRAPAARHLRRQQYAAQRRAVRGHRAACRRFSAEGTALLGEKQYTAASAKFLQSLNEATLCCTKRDPELAVAYYNLGRCCELRGQLAEAAFFLDNCLTLRTHFDAGSDRWRKAAAAVDRVQAALRPP